MKPDLVIKQLTVLLDMEKIVCTKCIMDTSDETISFDNSGICNHCIQYGKLKSKHDRQSKPSIEELIAKIKSKGKNHKYDCLVGLSGGTDSSFMLHTLISYGLRLLAVHYDSGWNSEEAIHNISILTKTLDTPLEIYKVDFETFKNVQKAYLKAGVVDLDVPTDHALYASLYETAAKHNIPFILSGHNIETESIMPVSWVADKLDSRNMKDICKKFGEGKDVSKFPFQTAFVKFRNYNIKKIETIFFLNHINYHKESASRLLEKEYGWQPVRVKHGESIWTRFYQCYILPTRFGIDKRKAHYSNLILSGNMLREDALQKIKEPFYLDNFEEDKKLILEKYSITEEEFEGYMKQQIRLQSDFKTEKVLKNIYSSIRNLPILKQILQISTRH